MKVVIKRAPEPWFPKIGTIAEIIPEEYFTEEEKEAYWMNAYDYALKVDYPYKCEDGVMRDHEGFEIICYNKDEIEVIE